MAFSKATRGVGQLITAAFMTSILISCGSAADMVKKADEEHEVGHTSEKADKNAKGEHTAKEHEESKSSCEDAKEEAPDMYDGTYVSECIAAEREEGKSAKWFRDTITISSRDRVMTDLNEEFSDKDCTSTNGFLEITLALDSVHHGEIKATFPDAAKTQFKLSVSLESEVIKITDAEYGFIDFTGKRKK